MGPLENTVMSILWDSGESSVHQVVQKLARPLAYTTVMTTLDRLYKKGLLVRRKAERAFYYAPRHSRQEWERKRAGDLLAGLLGASNRRELLISCLVDAVGRHDTALLDDLEREIKSRRKALDRRSKP